LFLREILNLGRLDYEDFSVSCAGNITSISNSLKVLKKDDYILEKRVLTFFKSRLHFRYQRQTGIYLTTGIEA